MTSRIMQYPLEWLKFTTGSFFLSSMNFVSQSPWTGRRGVSGPNAQIWRVRVTCTIQERDTWMAMEGWWAEAGGQSGLIRFPDFGKLVPNRDMNSLTTTSYFDESPATGFSDGTGFIDGLLEPSIYAVSVASRGDTSIVVGGLPVSESRVLRRGDCFEHRPNGIFDATPRFHMIIRDAPTDANGQTRLEFRPPLRGGIASGDQIVLTMPYGLFRLIDDSQAEVERSAPDFGNLGFELIEALV